MVSKKELANAIRFLSIDAVEKAQSGHPGMPMGMADIAATLWLDFLNHNPKNPDWFNRDRFVLSNGHGSMLLYALLHLTGYKVSIEDLKQFRQLHSITPGHPECGETPGVETTTGPLGQGLANAVGMAIAARQLTARYGENLAHHTYVIAGDGCLMEGISHEAASLAGHLGLDRLICIFDDNGITIDGSTALSCSDDVVRRFESYGWRVIDAGAIGNDLDALEAMLQSAKESSGKPTLCVVKTTIGDPSPTLRGKHEAHGNPFTGEHVAEAKLAMGIADEPFFAPPALVDAYRSITAQRGATFRHEAGAVPDEVMRIDLAAVSAALPAIDPSSSVATRVAIQKVLDATSAVLPQLVVGSADLTGNTGVKVTSFGANQRNNPDGRQIYYGIREHAMGAACVGMALHGGVIPVCGTFFVFADYMKPAIRLAALSKAKSIFVFSHDSVGVGEDGPTHQPIEQLASLRSIPGLQVIRPADSAETAQAWLCALAYDGPTALILSRQNLPQTTTGIALSKGFDVLRTGPNNPDVALVATGSEVSVALEAATLLEDAGVSTRVISLPSWERMRSSAVDEFRSAVETCAHSVSIEAGSTMGWHEFVDHPIGIDRFGASAPGNVVMEKLGLGAQQVASVVRSVVGR